MLGAVVLVVFVVLAAGGVWLATGGRRTALRTAVDTDQLLWVVGGVGLLALLWAAVVVAGFRMLLPRRISRGRRALGALVVTVLVAAVVVPAVWAGQLLLTQRELIAGVFDDGDSATVDDSPTRSATRSGSTSCCSAGTVARTARGAHRHGDRGQHRHRHR
ncbi:hypothetical protein [Blastococcus brunescens]|uniref:Uncharacterized protein n=1 Tax=Blastococcus brunescens TaxID=1564165 RepID=A0ABZ1B3P3_9ACTN|nr:hypothetical protein [Blastococcus sp. BMG 8361]WRL63670.1 hypothetical protein U6N30_29070 [Blastococcus sp. BMG 8361]